MSGGIDSDTLFCIESLDEAQGSTTIVDSGPHEFAITNNSSQVVHTTSVAKFGTSSLDFSQGTAARLRVTNVFGQIGGSVGVKPFCYEAFFNLTSTTETVYNIFTIGTLFSLHYYPSGPRFGYNVNFNTSTTVVPNDLASALTTGTWYHIAVVRATDGSTYDYIRLFLDGVLISETDVKGGSSVHNVATTKTYFFASGDIDTGKKLNARLDAIQFSLDTVRGATSTTYPVPTETYSPLPASGGADFFLPAFSVSGSGHATIIGSGSNAFQPVTTDGSGTAIGVITGTANNTFPVLSTTASGNAFASLIDGVGDCTFPVFRTEGGVINRGATVFPLLEVTGEGNSTIGGKGTALFNTFSTVGYGGGVGDAGFPLFSGSGAGAAYVHGGGEAVFPAFQVQGHSGGDGSATFPSMGSTGAGTVEIMGVGAATFPLLVGTGSGDIDIIGTGGASFKRFQCSGVGGTFPVGVADFTFPLFSAAGKAKQGSSGVANITFPLFTSSAVGSYPCIGGGSFSFPKISVFSSGYTTSDETILRHVRNLVQ